MILLVGKLFGLVNAVLMPVVFIYCFKINGFKLTDETVSSSGKPQKTRKLFNQFLIISGIMQTVFVATIVYELSLIFNPLVSLPPVIAGTFMILSGVISTRKNEEIHNFFGWVMFLILISWGLYFHVIVLPLLGTIGMLLLIVALSLSLGSIAFSSFWGM